VNAEREDVIVTNGARHAFDLIARVRLVPRACCRRRAGLSAGAAAV
jgi:hypothetical protein